MPKEADGGSSVPIEIEAHRERDPIETSVVYLIDADRCTLNTEKVLPNYIAAIRDVSERYRMGDIVSELEYVKEKIESTGGSFDLIGALRGILDDKGFSGVLPEINSVYAALVRDNDELLFQGAIETLHYLDDQQRYKGIITYGGAEWQNVKISNTDLRQWRVTVVGSPRKSDMIASWKQSDGRFLIPAGLVAPEPVLTWEVVLVDDKPKAFEGMVDGMRGYLVVRDDEGAFERQVSNMGGKAVTVIDDLRTIIIEEQRRTDEETLTYPRAS